MFILAFEINQNTINNLESDWNEKLFRVVLRTNLILMR